MDHSVEPQPDRFACIGHEIVDRVDTPDRCKRSDLAEARRSDPCLKHLVIIVLLIDRSADGTYRASKAGSCITIGQVDIDMNTPLIVSWQWHRLNTVGE